MNNLKKRSLSLVFTLLSIILLVPTCWAQNSTPEMATFFRSNGKIYVVVLVLATIFAGLFIFLIYLDKKIKNIEKIN
jgi:hypothetical protein